MLNGATAVSKRVAFAKAKRSDVYYFEMVAQIRKESHNRTMVGRYFDGRRARSQRIWPR